MKSKSRMLNFHEISNLMISLKGERFGFEFKWAEAPNLTKPALTACETLHLKKCYLIYPGKKSRSLTENIFVIGLEEYLDNIEKKLTIPRFLRNRLYQT